MLKQISLLTMSLIIILATPVSNAIELTDYAMSAKASAKSSVRAFDHYIIDRNTIGKEKLRQPAEVSIEEVYGRYFVVKKGKSLKTNSCLTGYRQVLLPTNYSSDAIKVISGNNADMLSIPATASLGPIFGVCSQFTCSSYCKVNIGNPRPVPVPSANGGIIIGTGEVLCYCPARGKCNSAILIPTFEFSL